jgi:hypothetical protein
LRTRVLVTAAIVVVVRVVVFIVVVVVLALTRALMVISMVAMVAGLLRSGTAAVRLLGFGPAHAAEKPPAR